MVFGYVRVSTENQLENYSIEEQIERLNSYCKAKDWILLKTYTDGGYSGGNTDRPALQALLRDIKENNVNAVVVYKLDRLSRSQKDTLTLIEDEFLKNGVDFVSINENFDTSTPFGRAMIGILSVFAQLEKDQITERFTMGRVGRGKAGYFHGGASIPFGYVYQNGELVIDEYEAMQIREIYDSFLAGKSINAIGREMQGKYTRKWDAVKIRNALTNSVYIGKVKFASTEYDGRHTPVISRDVFDQVRNLLFSQAREDKKTSAQKTPFRANFLLSSLVYCGRCGARYSGNHGYYKCYSRAKSSRKFIIDPNCKNDHWDIDELNKRVLQSINELVHDKRLLNNLLQSNTSVEPKTNHEAIEKRLGDIEKQVERLIQLFQVGSIPMENITQRLNDLDTEKKRLEGELARNNSSKTDKINSFLDRLNSFKDNFDHAPLDTQRLLISSLIQSIILDGDRITVNWRL